MKQKMMVACLILSAVSASSCATLQKSVLTGSSVGMTARVVASTAITGGGAQNFQLSAPDVDKECFDWEVRGNQLVQQHCIWTIRGNATWSPSPRRRK